MYLLGILDTETHVFRTLGLEKVFWTGISFHFLV